MPRPMLPHRRCSSFRPPSSTVCAGPRPAPRPSGFLETGPTAPSDHGLALSFHGYSSTAHALGPAFLVSQAVSFVDLRDLVVTAFAEAGVRGAVLMYISALAWLALRWAARPRRRRLAALPRGIPAGRGLVRVLCAVSFVTLGLLLTVARSAGRSTFHSGARF